MIKHSKHDFEVLIATNGFTVAENRHWLVAQAKKRECDYLLLTDDDMIFEQDVLEKLLAHDKDITAGTYHVRREVEEVVNAHVIEFFDEDDSIENHKELFKCKSIGGGMLLIKTDVFNFIGRPYFSYEVETNGFISMSNDWWFCRQARNAGYDIWCDPTLNIKHIGEYEY